MNFSFKCYYISREQKNWTESQQYCRDRGADLVIIETKEEQEFLEAFKRKFWIGLTDAETERTWKWVDGATLSAGFWKSGEPNNANSGEDCACLESKDNQMNAWNDLPCNNMQNWICETTTCQ
ncbi:C-type lectin domain family 4 member E-like [Megalops cyprinoides]|uniref:C-type lectin domain family 4 member E-like n=1 Tax=Megalops cyprinoides TaxID=118141 RepID=UPI00186554DD|nr:C-type lectin domain family 4 member E-like [Megalops cyprinoides]